MRLRNVTAVVVLSLAFSAVPAAAHKEQTRLLPPVGAMIPFILSPAEVAKLAPEWLPADGRTINDAKSPLNGTTLPSMAGMFAMGSAEAEFSTENAQMVGGSRAWEADVVLNGTTSPMIVTDCTGFMDEAKNAFGGHAAVWDTPEPERACQHRHSLGSAKVTGETMLPLPPHRKVVFLVRVR